MARAIAALVAATAIMATGAAAQGGKQAAQRQAYTYAMRCYVANVYAANNRKKVGDTAKAAIYIANAKRAFDGTVALGRALGFSNQTMNGDLDEAEAREMGRFIADQNLFLETASTCKALGLM